MTISDYNFAGKKAIVRVDFNVPLNENGEITDDTRIRGALPTLKKIIADGGAAIIMSHMGKPKGKVNPKLSLGQIRAAVEKALGCPVAFAPDCAKAQDAAKALKMGEALMLENLRYYPEEEGKPEGICQDTCQLCRLLRDGRLRNGSQKARFDCRHRRLFRRRQQDARLPDGERS